MGKYDILAKYLGNESLYEPNQIIEGLDTIEDPVSEINNNVESFVPDIDLNKSKTEEEPIDPYLLNELFSLDQKELDSEDLEREYNNKFGNIIKNIEAEKDGEILKAIIENKDYATLIQSAEEEKEGKKEEKPQEEKPPEKKKKIEEPSIPPQAEEKVEIPSVEPLPEEKPEFDFGLEPEEEKKTEKEEELKNILPPEEPGIEGLETVEEKPFEEIKEISEEENPLKDFDFLKTPEEEEPTRSIEETPPIDIENIAGSKEEQQFDFLEGIAKEEKEELKEETGLEGFEFETKETEEVSTGIEDLGIESISTESAGITEEIPTEEIPIEEKKEEFEIPLETETKSGLEDLTLPEIETVAPEEKIEEKEEIKEKETPGIDTDFLNLKAQQASEEETIDLSALTSQPKEEEKIYMDEKKALRIREQINKLKDPSLKRKIRRALLSDSNDIEAIKKLITMLLLNEPESEISDFVEANLVEMTDEEIERLRQEELKAAKRKIIYSEEAKRVLEFQAEFRNMMKIASFAFLVFFIIGFILWRFIIIPKQAEKHYKAGLKALSTNDFYNAEKEFYIGKEINGTDIKWYNRYGMAYFEKKKYDLAEKKLTLAYSNDFYNKTTLSNLSLFYRTYPDTNYEKAISIFSNYYKKYPTDFFAVNSIGRSYIEWGDREILKNKKYDLYNKARDYYTAYITKKPKDVKAHFELLDLGLRYATEKQIDDMLKAIYDIDKKAMNEKVLTKLARYYLDNYRIDKAKEVFDKVMKARPKIDSAHYEFGRFLAINGDYINALRFLSNAIYYNPNNAKAYNLIGEIKYKQDPYNSVCEEFFKKAISIDRNFYKPYQNLGHFYFYKTKTDIIYDRNSIIDKTLQDAFYNYRIARLLKTNYTEEDTLLSYNLSWLYYYFGFYEEAISELSAIYILQPYNPTITYFLANLYMKTGKLSMAKLQYDKSIDYYNDIYKKMHYINPLLERHQEILMQLARSYNNRGVYYYIMSQKSKELKDLEQKALLDFYKAKEIGDKIDNKPYPYAEVNIKNILNKNLKNRTPVIDDYVPRTSNLLKFIKDFNYRILGKESSGEDFTD